jgi:hypothetical protein
MSIINSTFGFVFVHVPKTGGTSLTMALAPLNRYNDLELGGTEYGEKLQLIYAGRHGLTKHSRATEMRAVMGAEAWNGAYRFTLVRNPYTRAGSTFAYLKHFQDHNPFMKQFDNLDDFVRSEIWLQPGPDRLLDPQHLWVRDTDGGLMVDAYFRLESFPAALRDIGDRIGLDQDRAARLRFPHANRIRRDPGELPPMAADVRERIATRYEADFRAFGYEI